MIFWTHWRLGKTVVTIPPCNCLRNPSFPQFTLCNVPKLTVERHHWCNYKPEGHYLNRHYEGPCSLLICTWISSWSMTKVVPLKGTLRFLNRIRNAKEKDLYKIFTQSLNLYSIFEYWPPFDGPTLLHNYQVSLSLRLLLVSNHDFK